MASSTVQHIIDVKFQYADLVKGWSETSAAIESATKKLNEFTEDTPREEIAKQTNLIKALKNNLNQLTKEIQANVKIESQQVGSINQLNAAITKLTARYNALSRTEREGAKGKAFEEKIRQLKTEVNAANASLLDFRNNVGNYAGGVVEGFTRLGFSVQQVARELPSLSHSFSQFFLAISNNLPMLADELQRATKANKALKAEGKATVPVWKQLTKSIFSWQTLLVVGITLLTAYGKEIVSFVKGLFGAKEAAISMAKAQQNVNAELQKNGFGIGDQIAKFESLRQAWNNLAGDLDAKKKFVTENKEAFDGLGVVVNDVKDAENLLVDNTDAFIDALKLRAIASAGMKLAAEKYEEALKIQIKNEEEFAKAKSAGQLIYQSGSVNGAPIYQQETEIQFARRLDKLRKDAKKEEEIFKQQAESYLTLANAKIAEAKATLESANIKESAGGTGGVGGKTLDEIIREGTEKLKLKPIRIKSSEFIKLDYDMDKELDKMSEDADRKLQRGLVKLMNERAAEYENRMLKAQLSGGEKGAQDQLLTIAKEQISILEDQLNDIDAFESAYRAMGYSQIEIDNMRLNMLYKLKGAQKELENVQNESNQAGYRGAEQLFGALGELGQAAGASAGLTAMLAIAQSAAALGAALQKAFSSSATIWDAIAGAVAAIATVTTVITQIKSLNSSAKDEQAKYSFSTGGLVTGAGTSTSDSITAKLSNGEAVMTAQAVNDWGAVLSAMNVSSGGRAIDTSNLPQRGGGMEGMKQLMKEVMLEMPAPVVSVVDINRGQSRVKVADNLGRLKGRNKA